MEYENTDKKWLEIFKSENCGNICDVYGQHKKPGTVQS